MPKVEGTKVNKDQYLQMIDNQLKEARDNMKDAEKNFKSAKAKFKAIEDFKQKYLFWMGEHFK
jgi:hypothetical protein